LTRGHPLVPRLHVQTQPIIIHPQIAIAVAPNSIGHDGLDFLRHHADIGLIAPFVAEAIKAKAVVEPAQHDDVLFEPDVGPMVTAAMVTPMVTAAVVPSMVPSTMMTAAMMTPMVTAAVVPSMVPSTMVTAAMMTAVMTAMVSVVMAAVVMPATPALTAAPAYAVVEFVADDVPTGAVPAVVIPTVGITVPLVFDVWAPGRELRIDLRQRPAGIRRLRLALHDRPEAVHNNSVPGTGTAVHKSRLLASGFDLIARVGPRGLRGGRQGKHHQAGEPE